MTTTLNYDINKKFTNGFGLVFSDTVYSVSLSASTATSLTVPGTMGLGMPGCSSIGHNRFLAVFTYTTSTDVWVANNTTAAIQSGHSFALAPSTLNPAAKIVKSGDVLSFISAGTPNITVEFFSILEN